MNDVNEGKWNAYWILSLIALRRNAFWHNGKLIKACLLKLDYFFNGHPLAYREFLILQELCYSLSWLNSFIILLYKCLIIDSWPKIRGFLSYIAIDLSRIVHSLLFWTPFLNLSWDKSSLLSIKDRVLLHHRKK